MIKVVLLGAGNVAYHLSKVFQKTDGVEIVQHYRRNAKEDDVFNLKVPRTNSLKKLKSADLYIIAIKDDSIAALSRKLNITEGLVVHTSGSVSMNELHCSANKGVFYPLQSFSKNENLHFKEIPICIETELEEDMHLLRKFAHLISDKVFEINSLQREKLHIAAVFANNFTNHMYKIAKDICDENNFSFDVLKPLIKNTAKKIEKIAPEKAQTGPAIRNDKKIIKKHLKQLKSNQKDIYELITKSIIKTRK